MIERGPAPETEMVLAFVAAEIDSPTWGPRYSYHLRRLGRTPEDLVGRPEFNPADNRDRAELLKSVRGYGQNTGLFLGFPQTVRWRRAELEPADFAALRYARCPPWTELAPATLTVAEGARNLETVDTQDDYRSKVHGIIARIQRGDRFPPLILAETTAPALILIEGHTRATAYALQAPARPIEVLVGSSPEWGRWAFH